MPRKPHVSYPERCPDQYISSTNPKMYDDISAGEFLNERLIEIGLVKGK
ncbi:MAG: hypothetical protein ISP74_09225 [Bacteroidia bacterium]|nr:hypothetical protein [Bacteroidia bacterium]